MEDERDDFRQQQNRGRPSGGDSVPVEGPVNKGRSTTRTSGSVEDKGIVGFE